MELKDWKTGRHTSAGGSSPIAFARSQRSRRVKPMHGPYSCDLCIIQEYTVSICQVRFMARRVSRMVLTCQTSVKCGVLSSGLGCELKERR